VSQEDSLNTSMRDEHQRQTAEIKELREAMSAQAAAMATLNETVEAMSAQMAELEAARSPAVQPDAQVVAVDVDMDSPKFKDDADDGAGGVKQVTRSFSESSAGEYLIQKPENLYSFMLEMMIFPASDFRGCFRVLLMLFLIAAQSALAFGFWDASWLDNNLQMTNLLGGAMPQASFYPDSSIANDRRDFSVPAINIIAGLIGIFLLCLEMYKDNTTTLMHPPPCILFQRVVFAEGLSLKTRVWRAFSVSLMHIAWTIRALFVPAAAGLGTSYALGNADKLIDLVLNSIAVAFIFDIDESMYFSLILPHIRTEYVDRPSHLPKQHQPKATRTKNSYARAWVFALYDSCFMVYNFCVAAWKQEPVNSFITQPFAFFIFDYFVIGRSALYGIYTIIDGLGSWLKERRRLQVHGREPSGFRADASKLIGIVVGAAICVGSGFLTFYGMVKPLSAVFGARGPEPGSALETCLGMWLQTQDCAGAMLVSNDRGSSHQITHCSEALCQEQATNGTNGKSTAAWSHFG